MVDIYKRTAAYARLRKAVEKWPINQGERLRVTRYLSDRIEHRSPGRRYSDIVLLKRLFCGTKGWGGRPCTPPLIEKPLDAFTVDDFRELRTRLQEEATNRDTFRKLADHARHLYHHSFGNDKAKHAILDALFQTGVRRFFQWPKHEPINTSITKDRFYTLDELMRLLRVARRPQERALLALAWETTARPNEYLSLTCGDVKEHPKGFIFTAHVSKQRSGETRTRNLYVFAFRADFNTFWRTHPFRDQPSAPLFFRDDNSAHRGQPLGASGCNKTIKKLDRLSGINKNGTLYFLRHGGYTWKRQVGMNPALADRDMGWAPGTKQQRRYLHLHDEDVMAERLRLANESPESLPQRDIRAPSCPACNTVNSPADDRCATCGHTLDIDHIITEHSEQKAIIEALIETKLQSILKKHDLEQVDG